MRQKIRKSNLIYRELKISDYQEFKKLFFICFKKKVSFYFYKWRYFNNKYSFCYGVFEASKLIANVGMNSVKLNNNIKENSFSRHSSMVLKKYRGFGIFSELSKIVKKKISKNVQLVCMWPNKNNFANFGIDKKRILKNKYYLYKSFLKTEELKKIRKYNIDEIFKFKNHIKNKNNFFYKDFLYFKNRYLLYQKNVYFINKFNTNKLTSFFILKRNKDITGFSYVILDHFGSEKIKDKHFSYLLENQNKLIFLSKKRINKFNIKLLNNLYFKIGFFNRLTLKQKKNILYKKEIFLGDTDIFISTEKK
tara:strand:+ start:24246 stop:25166 length:921 start_codon:yes stop_codon:yes gene_type:complete